MRDVEIELHIIIAGKDWKDTGLNTCDVLAEIRDALDNVLKIQRFQTIRVKMKEEGKEYGISKN